MKGKRAMATAIISVATIVLGGLLAWSVIGSRGEQSKYQVVSKSGDIELRDYAPRIIAEVETTGEREEAITQGFKILADYIFGNNKSRVKVSMTAPVTQQPSEKIAMTAPVTQKNIDGKWQVRFMMPSNYDMASLPQPNDDKIQIKEIPRKRYAIIRFSGLPTQDILKEKLQQLQEFVQVSKMEQISEPTYAFFNPPWTLPPMRRTEIMIEIVKR